MQILSSDDIHAMLDYASLIEALRKAHAEGAIPRTDGRVMDEPPAGDNKFVSLVAWAAGDVIAVKLVGVFPSNLSLPQPEPSVQGLVALFNGKTGAPVLAADGAAMTFRKTAADSGLGSSLLAREDAEVLLVVGAGGLAPHVAMAHKAARPSIRDIRIWNRTEARAHEVAKALQAEGYPARVAADLDAAVAQADIVSCVTMATAPLVKGALLKPGAHVDLIGAYLPNMREADDDVVLRASLFVDTRVGYDHSGEIADPIAKGLITVDSIRGDLFELCSGQRPGRRSPEEITMYKNVGGAHLDLFTARHLMAVAGA